MPDLTVETVAISTLTPDPNNARRHDQRNVDAIAASLREFGQRKPIVVSQDDVIVAGNGTVTAMLAMGWTHVAVTRLPWDDLDKCRAFAIADNRTAELAEWDGEVLLETLTDLGESWQPFTGFDAADVKALEVVYGEAPSVADGRDDVGDRGERDLWPWVKFKVDPATKARWDVVWQGFEGRDDSEKINAFLDALGIPGSDYAEGMDDQP